MTYSPIYFITSASSSAGVLTLTVSGAPSIAERGVARFVFAPNVAVPSGAASTETVSLSIGGETYDLLDKFGMPMTLSELPIASQTLNGSQFFATRKAIVCGIGSAEAGLFFIAWNLPVPTEFIIPLR